MSFIEVHHKVDGTRYLIKKDAIVDVIDHQRKGTGIRYAVGMTVLIQYVSESYDDVKNMLEDSIWYKCHKCGFFYEVGQPYPNADSSATGNTSI